MHAGGGKPQHGVAGLDIAARQQGAALDRADREAREIVVAVPVKPRHFGGLAADQGAAGLAAAGRDAGHHDGADFWLKLAAGEIVEKE